MLVLAGIAGACGWLARGLTPLPVATAAPTRAPIVIAAPPVIQLVMAPTPEPEAVPEIAEVADPDDEVAGPDEDPSEAAGEDLGSVIARAEVQTPEHNAISGVVTEERSGEPLVGVTVIASGGRIQGTQAAITDEQGRYKISNLPVGYATATFYYADLMLERTNVVVSSLDPTLLDQRLDTMPPRGQAEYTMNIPVQTRTFEAALDAAGDDEFGTTISSNCGVENTYVIE